MAGLRARLEKLAGELAAGADARHDAARRVAELEVAAGAGEARCARQEAELAERRSEHDAMVDSAAKASSLDFTHKALQQRLLRIVAHP